MTNIEMLTEEQREYLRDALGNSAYEATVRHVHKTKRERMRDVHLQESKAVRMQRRLEQLRKLAEEVAFERKFKRWLNTDEGSALVEMPVTSSKYLINRLRVAFKAGMNTVNNCKDLTRSNTPSVEIETQVNNITP